MPHPVRVGSDEHKALLCRFFIESHSPYDPATIRWPDLDAESLARLRSLPFWTEAVSTERTTACTVQTFAATVTDPLLHEAITLQAYEEQRHAALLHGLTTHYDIPVPSRPEPQPPVHAEWAFLCTGYSECFDAFFTFALFAIARDCGFFPPPLIDLFEPIVQEEARHTLFFVNWEAYLQARRPLWQRPRYLWWGIVGRGLQVWQRLQMAYGFRRQGDFTVKGHQALQATMSPRDFLHLCLQENTRRLGQYDARLLRPRLVPLVATTLARVLR
jgi:hypothetical protein